MKNINTWSSKEEYRDEFQYRIDNMLSLLNLNNINSVMDLGCGKQTLKNKLPDTIKYIGVDLHQHIDGTIVKDFNNNEFHNENVDVIFCSGIFEYIYDMETFAKNISNNTNIVIGSYNFVEDIKDNRGNIWVNYYDMNTFFKIWSNLGYNLIFISKWETFNNYLFPSKTNRIFILANNNYNTFILNNDYINHLLFKEYIMHEKNIISNINLKIDKLINSIAWWIPVKKWRDNFRNNILYRTGQDRTGQ